MEIVGMFLSVTVVLFLFFCLCTKHNTKTCVYIYENSYKVSSAV